MKEPWDKPYGADTWRIESVFSHKTFLFRKDRYKATAVGFCNGEVWARYSGVLGNCGWGYTREEAILNMQSIICNDIHAYQAHLKKRDMKIKNVAAEQICPHAEKHATGDDLYK